MSSSLAASSWPTVCAAPAPRRLPPAERGADGDGDALTFSVLAGPFNGTLSGTPPNLTYTPNLHFNGTDLLSYQAHDGIFASAIVVDGGCALLEPGVPALKDDNALTLLSRERVRIEGG